MNDEIKKYQALIKELVAAKKGSEHETKCGFMLVAHCTVLVKKIEKLENKVTELLAENAKLIEEKSQSKIVVSKHRNLFLKPYFGRKK